MHPINERLDRKLPKLKCDKSCKNYRFDHLETACVLSDVFSVKKGELCAIRAEPDMEAKEVEYSMYESKFKNQTVGVVAEHDGARFEAVKLMISKMYKGDLQLITDYCIELERAMKQG